MSRPCFLPLYRYLLRKLNKDTLNVVLKYVFGETRRTIVVEAEDISQVVCTENILSIEDFDAFLRHELY